MLWSIDTEDTGLDFYHGAKPFFVTACSEAGDQKHWEWDVDPLTREPRIPRGDLEEILMLIEEADELVLQNAKFDVTALKTIGAYTEWPWSKTHDTLNAGHLLASNQPHNLTDMAMHYLGVDIQPLETCLEIAVKACRTYVKRHLPAWKLAKEGDPSMPSATGKVWKLDSWLPRTLAAHLWGESEAARAYRPGMGFISLQGLSDLGGWDFHPPELSSGEDVHPWWTVLRDYANADSAVTVALWQAMKERLKERKLWSIYEAIRDRPYLAHRLETVGVTVSKCRLDSQVEKYSQESVALAERCESIAASYDYPLELPKGGRNDNLERFVFEVMQVPVLARTPAGRPSMDRATMSAYLDELDPRSRGGIFIKALLDKRSRDTAVQYLRGYTRFWLPTDWADWFLLHPSLNPTGTDTTRWSSQNPNEQNISAKEGFNLRYCFGPAPGREWWSCDAKNIELRLPVYECGEEAFIELFEHPDDPPYYGSNHLLIAHLLHREKFESCFRCATCKQEIAGDKRKEGAPYCECSVRVPFVCGNVFKDRYKPWYKRVKNGNFATQYGCQQKKGDATYGVAGAFRMIAGRFVKQAALGKHWIKFAEKNGYVETMPDRSVDSERGYPLLCTRTEWGKILPTVPLSYHIQGTACWWMLRAMGRCLKQLDQWSQQEGKPYRMVMQVHDELVFDFPKAADPAESNLGKIRTLQQIMEQGGTDLGVPTPTSATYHAASWAEGVDY